MCCYRLVIAADEAVNYWRHGIVELKVVTLVPKGKLKLGVPISEDFLNVSRLYLLFKAHTGLGMSSKRRLSSSHRSTVEPWSCDESAVPATGVLFHALAIQEECHGYHSSPHGVLRDVDRVLVPAAAGA